jgi:hypothetical protein
VKITYGSATITTSENKRLYLDINPAGNEENVLNVDAINSNKKLISSAAAGAGGSTGCNYSMIVSKKFGLKLNGFGKNCSKSEDHYTPQQPAVYTFINNSSHTIYVAFDQSNGFASDSIEGWLKPSQSRMYDENTSYWQYQGIKNGDEIRTAVSMAISRNIKNAH